MTGAFNEYRDEDARSSCRQKSRLNGRRNVSRPPHRLWDRSAAMSSRNIQRVISTVVSAIRRVITLTLSADPAALWIGREGSN